MMFVPPPFPPPDFQTYAMKPPETDALGRTPLHRVHAGYADPQELRIREMRGESICELCRKHAAAVNWKDIFGRSPIFNAVLRNDDPCSTLFKRTKYRERVREDIQSKWMVFLESLLECGASPWMTDASGVSVLHYAAGRGESKMLQLLLGRLPPSYVQVQDPHGSTLLHYAVFANCTNTTQMLLNLGCDRSITDCHGRTPLAFAEELGFTNVATLIRGRETCNERPPLVFQCKDSIELSDASLAPFRGNEEDFNAFCDSLLESPILGNERFSRDALKRCYGDADELHNEVMSFMQTLADQCGQKNPLLAFTPKLRGSAAEGTKSGLPNEYDFLLIMEAFGQKCNISKFSKCKKYVDVHYEGDSWQYRRCIIRSKSLQDRLHYICHTGKVKKDFCNMLEDVLKKPEVWLNIPFKFVIFGPISPGANLVIRWTGASYKLLNISIDLIPCISLSSPERIQINWPQKEIFSNCRLMALLKIDYDDMCELSYSDFEEAIMKSLPPNALRGYVLAKAICSPYVTSITRNRHNELESVQCIFSSYVLKNALLKEVRSENRRSSVSTVEWTKRIFRCLSTSVEERSLRTICGERELFGDCRFKEDANNALMAIAKVVPLDYP